MNESTNGGADALDPATPLDLASIAARAVLAAQPDAGATDEEKSARWNLIRADVPALVARERYLLRLLRQAHRALDHAAGTIANAATIIEESVDPSDTDGENAEAREQAADLLRLCDKIAAALGRKIHDPAPPLKLWRVGAAVCVATTPENAAAFWGVAHPSEDAPAPVEISEDPLVLVIHRENSSLGPVGPVSNSLADWTAVGPGLLWEQPSGPGCRHCMRPLGALHVDNCGIFLDPVNVPPLIVTAAWCDALASDSGILFADDQARGGDDAHR